MTQIAFIGVGNMGNPMARNLIKAGHGVAAHDLSAELLAKAAEAGARAASSAADAATGAEVVITMLPAGKHVQEVCLGGLFDQLAPGTLVIDCSTIDVDTSRDVHAAAAAKGLVMVDAPVSGGVGGAEAATLTFMVGGGDDAFQRAKPILEKMGKTIVHGLRPVLVADHLLPGAGPGADLARQPGLRPRLRGRPDAEGYGPRDRRRRQHRRRCVGRRKGGVAVSGLRRRGPGR